MDLFGRERKQEALNHVLADYSDHFNESLTSDDAKSQLKTIRYIYKKLGGDVEQLDRLERMSLTAKAKAFVSHRSDEHQEPKDI